jgi:hypothetical protein
MDFQYFFINRSILNFNRIIILMIHILNNKEKYFGFYNNLIK